MSYKLYIALLNMFVAGLLVFLFTEDGGFRLYASVFLLMISSFYMIYFFFESRTEKWSEKSSKLKSICAVIIWCCKMIMKSVWITIFISQLSPDYSWSDAGQLFAISAIIYSYYSIELFHLSRIQKRGKGEGFFDE